MLKHKQLNKHNPEAGIYGDCGRTCIACLLNMTPSDVPHFFDKAVEDGIEKMDLWLEKRGIRRLAFPIQTDDLETALLCGNSIFNTNEYTLLGLSKNQVNHIVICKGDKIIHDPSLDNSGIIGPADDGYFWLEFLFRDINIVLNT